jgi:hypothetical protein
MTTDSAEMITGHVDMKTTLVIAEDAPIGVQLWPTVSPEYAKCWTLAKVIRTANSVIWEYEDGKTREFLPGDKVACEFPREILGRGERVEIQDNGRDPSRYEHATIVAAAYRAEEFGYFIRYDNECVVWMRDWYVRSLSTQG